VNKRERDQMAAMCVFISNLYHSVGMEVPEDFDPDEESMMIHNAIRYEAQKNYALQLLHAKNTPEERVDLEERMKVVSEPF